MHRAMRFIRIVIVLALLSGCSANHNAVFRHRVVSSNSITTVDAKQRAILSKGNGKGSKDANANHQHIFCSEPSPDVFSVVAQAFSASGSLGKSADPKTVEAALQAAFTSAEQGSTIPRTQTINMLRELMFRTCERYLDGAYSALEMSIQAIRDQRLIVSILAIEQLTGTVAPKPVVIGATGTANAGAGEAAIVRLDDARKAKTAAEVAHAKAQSAYDELNGDKKECDAIADAVEKGTDLTDDQKAKQSKCNEARTNLASAKGVLASNTEHYADLKRLAVSAGIAAATTVSSTAPGGFDRAHAEAVEKIAHQVTKIVHWSFDDDTEVMLFCIKALTDKGLLEKMNPTALEKLQASCLRYTDQRVQLEEQKLLEEINASARAMELEDRKQFDSKWQKLQSLNTAQKDKLVEALKKQLSPTDYDHAECFKNANSEDEHYECFRKLPSRLKRDFPGMG